MHNMAVRQNESVRCEDETRTGPAMFSLMKDFDFNDSRADSLSRRDYGFRIGIEQRRICDHVSELMPEAKFCKQALLMRQLNDVVVIADPALLKFVQDVGHRAQ